MSGTENYFLELSQKILRVVHFWQHEDKSDWEYHFLCMALRLQKVSQHVRVLPELSGTPRCDQAILFYAWETHDSGGSSMVCSQDMLFSL